MYIYTLLLERDTIYFEQVVVWNICKNSVFLGGNKEKEKIIDTEQKKKLIIRERDIKEKI